MSLSPPPPTFRLLAFLLFLSIASCELIQNSDKKGEAGDGSPTKQLSAEDKAFIAQFKSKEPLYVTSVKATQDMGKSGAAIDERSGGIILGEGNGFGIANNLELVKAFSKDKAVYLIRGGTLNGKYILLAFQSSATGSAAELFQASSAADKVSDITDSTAVSSGNGALYAQATS